MRRSGLAAADSCRGATSRPRLAVNQIGGVAPPSDTDHLPPAATSPSKIEDGGDDGPLLAAMMAGGAVSPQVAVSLERERSLRRSAESAAAEQEALEQALQAQLASVQDDIDRSQYQALIDDMDDADVAEACADAGLPVRRRERMRLLLLDHLCGDPSPSVHGQRPVTFVAADDDDDDDDDADSDDDGEEDEDDELEEEEILLEQKLQNAREFRDDIVCLTPPSSEGEAENHIDALDEIDAEIVALQERLQSFHSRSRSLGRTSTSTSRSFGTTRYEHPQLEPGLRSGGDGGGDALEESSSAKALLAAAGLELSPGGSSYRVIGRKQRSSTPSPRREPPVGAPHS